MSNACTLEVVMPQSDCGGAPLANILQATKANFEDLIFQPSESLGSHVSPCLQGPCPPGGYLSMYFRAPCSRNLGSVLVFVM